MKDPYERGQWDCHADWCENCPFGSVGGLEARAAKRVPPVYIPENERAVYFRGYVEMARRLFGEDWQTCEFGWKRAFVINEESTT